MFSRRNLGMTGFRKASSCRPAQAMLLFWCKCTIFNSLPTQLNFFVLSRPPPPSPISSFCFLVHYLEINFFVFVTSVHAIPILRHILNYWIPRLVAPSSSPLLAGSILWVILVSVVVARAWECPGGGFLGSNGWRNVFIGSSLTSHDPARFQITT